MSGRMVERAVFESRLAQALAIGPGGAAGVFGPDSVTWRIARETALLVGGGRALLMQLAHPWVAQGVADHSVAPDAPWRRLRATLATVHAITFGDVAAAAAAARRLHTVHGRITGKLPAAVGPWSAGSRYAANEEGALAWVHATLVDASLQVFERVVRPLTPREQAAFLVEARRAALLYGAPADAAPTTPAAFRTWMANQSRAYAACVGAPAKAAAQALFAGPAWGPERGPFGAAPAELAALTTALLPPAMRAAFGLDFDRRAAARARRAVALLRTARRLAPAGLRFTPAYHEARDRLGLARRPRLAGAAATVLPVRGGATR